MLHLRSLSSPPYEEGLEYRRHAEECRTLARGVQGEQRDQLLGMAATWDNLAAERTEFIKKHPELLSW